MAICWLLLYQKTGNTQFRDAAFAANSFVRRTVRLDGPMETRGAVKGSFPVNGEYGQFQYPNWACKFFVDAQRLELDVRADEGEAAAFPPCRSGVLGRLSRALCESWMRSGLVF